MSVKYIFMYVWFQIFWNEMSSYRYSLVWQVVDTSNYYIVLQNRCVYHSTGEKNPTMIYWLFNSSRHNLGLGLVVGGTSTNQSTRHASGHLSRFSAPTWNRAAAKTMAPRQCQQCACPMDDDNSDLCDACTLGATPTPNQPGTDVLTSQTQSSHIPPGQTDPRTPGNVAGSTSVPGDHDAGNGASVSGICIAGCPYSTDARLAIVRCPDVGDPITRNV